MAVSEPPNLKLVVLKGPREGETLEFQPGDLIRIGRVIRGNTKGYRNNVVIKDGGISSEHVSIEFDSGRWLIRDRGSSNGTILNDATLSPNTPFDLRHQDVVKIGERTSISVLIGHSNAVADNPAPICEVLKEDEVEPSAAEVVQNPRRGRRRKGQDLKGQGAAEVAVDLTVDDSKPVLKPSPRRTRGKKIENSLVSVSVSDLNLGVKKRAGARRTKKNLVDQEAFETASIRVADNDNVAADSENVEGSNLGENAQIDVVVDKRNDNVSCFEEKNEVDVAVDKDNVDRPILGEDNSKGVGGEACSEAEAEKGNRFSSGKVREEPELAKMTLGEWFDYLEVHLPKQIVDETEQLIENMRQKAIRVHEYRLQQMREKCKEPVG